MLVRQKRRRIVDYPDEEQGEDVGEENQEARKKEIEDMDVDSMKKVSPSALQKGKGVALENWSTPANDCASSSSGATFPDENEITYLLLDMGFSPSDVATALKACGPSTPIGILISYITTQSQSLLTKQEQLESLGYTSEAVKDAIKFCGEDAGLDLILDFLLAQESHNRIETRSALICSSDEDEPTTMELLGSFGYVPERVKEAIEACGEDADPSELVEFMDAHHERQQNEQEEVPQSTTLDVLVSFGYARKYAEKAIETCGTEDLDVLVDFMDAHTVKHEHVHVEDNKALIKGLTHKEAEYRKALTRLPREPRRTEHREKKMVVTLDLRRKGGTGFGVYEGKPTKLRFLTPKQARPPYFYFENVASMPAGTWKEITSLLDGIEPEFADAMHFAACRRPRGYVHNLPIENRFRLLPIPPQTIKELLPHTAPFTPEWDDRDKLHCINTVNTGASVCRNVRTLLEKGELTEDDKRSIKRDLAKWNLVWTGPDTCATLEPHESEMFLGFPKYHTRGAITKGQQARSIGNAFQVDTVGFHLSALKSRFPNGIRVLSLFSGIGGAEVALHRAGIPLKFVVSVEKLLENRRILESWWASSKQTGKHIILDDVSKEGLSPKKLKELIGMSGGFDLIIGGSPCNNLSGNNRVESSNPLGRCGLIGEHSKLFYEFPRILQEVREIMGV